MPNLFDALNTDLSSQQAGEVYHSQVDPLVEATTEVNKANVVDTAQQEAWDKAQKKGAERTRLENEIAAIKVKISNLQNQVVEIDQDINNFNKPMSDEEIMRIGEQLNVPEVATNYINARSGRLNREFEAKKYDVAKDESKKTRKKDYESSMRNLTTEINILKDKKNNAAQVDKSGYDKQILGKQKELEVLDDEYSDEFGNSYLSSVKVDNTPASTPNTTTVDTKPSESTTSTVDNTTIETIVPIVPKGEGWGWGVDESTLNTTEQGALKEDVAWAKERIKQVKDSDYSKRVKDEVIAGIKGGRKTWSEEDVNTALYAANEKARAEGRAKRNEKVADNKDLKDLQDQWDKMNIIIKYSGAKEEQKEAARKWKKDNKRTLEALGGNTND